ncbi:MAG: hypothetical protein ACE5HI_09335 [bacterium]
MSIKKESITLIRQRDSKPRWQIFDDSKSITIREIDNKENCLTIPKSDLDMFIKYFEEFYGEYSESPEEDTS